MPIRVLRGMKGLLRGDPTVILLVRAAHGPDLDAAMHAARADIAALDAGWEASPGLPPGTPNTPKFVSDPVAVPGGMLLMMDLGEDLPPAMRDEIPAILTRRLAAAGVQDASIGPAPKIADRYFTLDRFVPAARAWLRGASDAGAPAVAERPSPALVDIGSSWLRAHHCDGHELLGLVISTEFGITWESLPAVANGVLDSGEHIYLLSSDFATGGAAVGLGDFYRHGMTLGIGGIGWSAADLASQLRDQREVVRANTDALDWASVGIVPDDRFFLYLESSPPAPGSAERRPLWYQLFSAEHLAYLGGPPDGSVTLPGGRVELTIGEPEQWYPEHPDHEEVRDRAHELLRLR